MKFLVTGVSMFNNFMPHRKQVPYHAAFIPGTSNVTIQNVQSR
jgi:hypothetical protein